ncbi:hypothetical protein G647_10002 [Cladophialophora carrionii CBS 160.54]|uniref:Uncharacterized protein n=1 Tax=Cladophialophora carrionii CBS 160.54 TaxID=1279043 RepID=V9DKT0_9EURO|nr:uncharacterized protein G647_10002 [Cladophialophora carrionii CBS 160.54]ETI26903.1 hypothetical protein G647_10002 [Cladophialophora carrionii CBS 160.54]
MAQDLLNCSICPKQPSFSDTSHLLTHVSSKGHLSEWHKLQVRSFQDLAAAVALANYNQWCQQHDIDRLLSERMQMKEDKQAKKRRIATTRNTSAPKLVPIDHELLDPPMPHKRTAKPKKQNQKKGTRGRQHREDEDGSDLDFSPVRRSRRKIQRPQICSPRQQSEVSNGAYPSLDDYPAGDNHPVPLQVLATPEHMKLKGIVWPGMDLFDAATQEMQQKRNQKKDASVLRRMERLAGLVEPTEVVYSPNGDNVLKARHIDDLEDASSLVEGETPVPRVEQPRPRKRKPLAETDANVPRLMKRKVKASALNEYDDLPFAHGLPPLPHLPSSSTGELYGASCRFFPIEDGDIKPSIESLAPRKRPPPQFEIFTDGSPRHHLTAVMNGTRNPLQLGPRVYGNGPLQQLPKVSAAWLQPQYQSALQYTDPYTTYRPVGRQYQTLYEPSITNENDPPMAETHFAFRGSAANPLAWKSPIRPAIVSGLSPSDSPFGSFFGIFPGGSPGDDPFMSTKNPLAGALVHFDDEKNPLTSKGQSDSPSDTGLSNETEV